jgi:hypothetical protein
VDNRPFIRALYSAGSCPWCVAAAATSIGFLA